MKMYVSNLSFHTNEDNLKALFEQFGSVSSAIIIADRETGQSRGFGFVEMSSDDESNQAMKGLNGREVEGRELSVSVAREKTARTENRRW